MLYQLAVDRPIRLSTGDLLNDQEWPLHIGLSTVLFSCRQGFTETEVLNFLELAVDNPPLLSTTDTLSISVLSIGVVSCR